MVLVYTEKWAPDAEVISDGWKTEHPFGDEKLAVAAFEVKSRMVVEGNEDFGISANVDEDADAGVTAEGGDDGAVKVNDVKSFGKLQESGLDKTTCKAYFKNYTKHLMGEVPEDEKEAWKPAIMEIVSRMVKEIAKDNGTIYFTESAFLEASEASKASPVFGYWVEGEDAERFVFLLHGLKAQKF